MARRYEFSRRARSARVLAVLIGIYTVLLAAIILVDAAWWLMAALALLTLPALWDLYRNTEAGVWLDETRLGWHSGRRTGALDLAEIDHMRFDTRWDFSVRVAAVLKSEKRVRLPQESLPPRDEFEAALNTCGIAVKRHSYSIL